jgi:hypothetical protein
MEHRQARSPAAPLPLAVLLAVAAACQRSTTTFGPEGAVPAESRPIVFGQSHSERFDLRPPEPAAGSQGGPAVAMRYEADVPGHWQRQPPSQFRDAVWWIDGDEAAQCYLTAQVGGSLRANVDRWYRQQFGLTPPDDAAIAALPTHPLLGEPALLLELRGSFQGKADSAMLLLARHRGGELLSTFRMTAPAAVAERERAAFLRAAASLRAVSAEAPGAAGAAAGGAAAGGAPGGAEAGRGQPAAAPGADPHGGGAQPTPAPAPFASEAIPAGWERLADTGSRSLRHRFGRGSECYVGQLGGAVGDILGVWCGEIGHPPLDAAGIAALARVPMLGGEAVLLDLRGPYRGMTGEPIDDARLLVAVLDAGHGVVFAKCVGPADEVESQREGFLAFCRGLKRGDG